MRRIGDYDETWLERQTPLGLTLKVIGFLVAVGLIISLIGLPLGWYKAGRDIVSPGNVKAQWQFAYDYDESLRAAASNWCVARQAELAAAGRGDRIALPQRESQRIAQDQNYARIKAEYDARLRDAFRAKWVKPSDVPTTAPELQTKLDEIGCKAPMP